MALIRVAAVVMAVAAAALAAPPAPGAATPAPPREHEVKAAFLYHFSQLVEWPAGATSGEAFVIGVVGPDPFGGALEQALAGKSVRSQPIRLRRFRGLDGLDAAGVHVLFVGGTDPQLHERALDAVGRQPVLTVGEADGFAERGGMIGFRVTRDGRVGFDINTRRAEAAGLRMSSQLLKLARIVGGGGR